VADEAEARAGDLKERVAILERIAADIRALRDRMDERVDLMDDRLLPIGGNHSPEFWWMMGVMLGGFAGLLGEMAYGFHWL